MHRFTTATAVVMTTVALTASGCSVAGGDESAQNAGVTIVQGVDAYGMDPALHTQVSTSSVLLSIYDPLVFTAPSGELIPGLAIEWENTAPTTWTFRLRGGVTFSNGEKFDADDVVYSINRALDPATKSPTASNLSTVKTVTAVDTTTVEIDTTQPDPLLPRRLTQSNFSSLIVPKDFTSAHGGKIPDDQPVGTGPYTLTQWVKDDHISLAAKAEYWGNDTFWQNGTKPASIDWKPLPEAAARISALKNGEADMITNVSPDLAATLTGDVRVQDVLADTAYFVTINTDAVPAFKDPRVRQALNYAVDKQSIVSTIMQGTATPSAVTLSENGFAYPKALSPYPYDPAKAKSLLEAAGYSNGLKVNLVSRKGRFVKDGEVVESMGNFLRAVGIDVEVQFVENGVWGQLGDQHNRGDLSFTGWSNASDPDLAWYPLLHCGQFQSYYCDPALDTLLDEGRNNIDSAVRESAYDSAGQKIYDDAPHIFLYQAKSLYGLTSRVDFAPNPDDQINVRNLTVKS